MQIDLANWFEIAAALIALICWIIKPAKCTAVLVIILIITLAVEFTSKYFNQLYYSENDVSYVNKKYYMYSLFNIIKFCGFIWFIFFLFKDNKRWQLYSLISSLVFIFVVVNITFGQGLQQYNNYSNVFGIIGLTAIALYKLLKFEDTELPVQQKSAVFIYLCVLFFYYSVNLPFYAFFHQMFAEDKSKAVQIYRVINDSGNYLFYTGLSVATVLYTFNHRNNMTVQPKMA